jgi:hypothetical protein
MRLIEEKKKKRGSAEYSKFRNIDTKYTHQNFQINKNDDDAAISDVERVSLRNEHDRTTLEEASHRHTREGNPEDRVLGTDADPDGRQGDLVWIREGGGHRRAIYFVNGETG